MDKQKASSRENMTGKFVTENSMLIQKGQDRDPALFSINISSFHFSAEDDVQICYLFRH